MDMNEVLTNTENRGRAWMVFQELKVSYTMAGKSVSDTTLGEVAQRISHDLLCSDGEIPEIFRRARAMKDIPTMAVLSKAFDAYRAESTSNDPLPDILDSRKAFERARAYDQLQCWCFANGWIDRFLYATEKVGGKWAHPEQMKSLKADAVKYGFRYIKEEAAKSGPVMAYEDYTAKTGDRRLSQITAVLTEACARKG